MTSRLKAIIFDFDGTLVDENHWFEKRWEKTITYATNNLGLKNFGRVFWRKYYEKGPKYKYHVNETLIELGYSLENLKAIVDKFLSEEVDEILMDGVVGCLYQLKDMYRLGIITNGREEFQLKRIKNAGIFKYFQAIICSAQEPKPSQAPYKECLLKLNVEPYEAVYVGDDCDIDFLAPTQLGMACIHFNPKNKDPEFKTNYQVKSFKELSELLNCLEYDE